MNFFDRHGIRKTYFYSFLAGVFLLVVGTWGQLQGQGDKKLSEQALQELFTTVMHHVKNDYVEEVPYKTLWYGAINGMLKSLGDAHTRFMVPELYSELRTETSGKFGGLGIEISMRDNVLVVVSPMEGTPAMRVGLKPGDKIIEIEKKSTSGMSLMDAVKLMRGEPGTSVNITVAREGEDGPLYFDITRDIIKLKIVASTFLEKEKFGYVKLKQFSESSGSDMIAALQDFKDKKARGVILDLRWDPGGLLDMAKKVANLFIKDGILVSTRGRHKELDKVYYADPNKAILPNLPIVVLVNGGSASASEIVTGAIKDHKRGKIVGEKTFGKGSVQSVIQLRDNHAIALTIQKYYTPSGVSIHKKGIEPDVVVKPLEFTKDDNRNYKKLLDSKFLDEFTKTHAEYNEQSIAAFKKAIQAKNIVLSDFAARYALRHHLDRNHKAPLIDLEFDVQLKKAIEVLESEVKGS